jgi:hypothetical protein
MRLRGLARRDGVAVLGVTAFAFFAPKTAAAYNHWLPPI